MRYKAIESIDIGDHWGAIGMSPLKKAHKNHPEISHLQIDFSSGRRWRCPVQACLAGGLSVEASRLSTAEDFTASMVKIA